MRGRLVLAPLVAIAGLAAFAACSNAYSGEFPSDAAADATVDAVEDAGSSSDASDAGEAAVLDGGGGGPDASDPCDRDGDGFRSIACDGGDDCDDLDSRAHPDAGFSTAAPTVTTKGDWNCDGVVTKQYAYGLSCTSLLESGNNCSTMSGFSGAPACGEVADFDTCAQSPGVALSCSVGTVLIRNQGCR